MLLSAVIVLIYTLLGGLTSAIYNEVLQFFLIVLGFAPLAILAVMQAGGWEGMAARLPAGDDALLAVHGRCLAESDGRRGIRHGRGAWVRAVVRILVHGLSGGAARHGGESMSAARRTPLIAAFPKMFMPFIVIVPGIAALALMQHGRRLRAAAEGDGGYDYDQALTTLMAQFYPSGMLGVGLTALMASFMSGMAGNVTAFNTVWTYDIYQSYIRRNAPDSHYLMVGPRDHDRRHRCCRSRTAYLAQHYNNIMDLLQLVFGFVNAPLFATFLLGMFWSARPAMAPFRLVAGTAAAALTHGLTVAEGKGGWLGHGGTVFPSTMAQNFWIAIWAWTACFVVTIVVSLVTKPKAEAELQSLVYGLTELPQERGRAWYQRPGPLAIVVGIDLHRAESAFLVDIMDLRIPSGCVLPTARGHPAG